MRICLPPAKFQHSPNFENPTPQTINFSTDQTLKTQLTNKNLSVCGGARACSEVWNLTLKMLGKRSNPELKAKAAETRGLLDFAVELLEKHAAKFRDRPGPKNPKTLHECLLASGKAAQKVEDIIRRGDREMKRETQRELLFHYMRHVNFYSRAGGQLTPKHHLMVHMIQRIGRRGNPRFYATYRDESLNGIIGNIAKYAHRLTFCQTIHFRYALLQELQPFGLGMF